MSSSSLPVISELPPLLTFLANPISSYFNANPPYNNVILDILIFTPPPQPPRLLLLQHAGGADPHAFSAFWQVPSGAPNAQDQTMLHALGRIISQQTGLRLTRVVTMSGTEFGPLIWNNAEAQWMRMMFIVEVAELTATSSPLVADWSGNYAFGEQHSYGVHGVSGPNSVDVDAVKVILNPVYHGQHVWSNEEDLKEFIDSGLYPTEERSQYQLMMEAFSMYKQDFHNSTR